MGFLAPRCQLELDLRFILKKKKPKATIQGTREGPPDTVCFGKPNTLEIPGPRRRNRASCNEMPTRVGLEIYFKEKTKGNYKRHMGKTIGHSLLW